jgi:hypothetical protein
MQFFKPENYFAVRDALIKAGRADLIGGCEGLIPREPAHGGDRGAPHAGERREPHRPPHSVANPATDQAAGERTTPPLVKQTGERRGRKTQHRRRGNRNPKPVR